MEATLIMSIASLCVALLLTSGAAGMSHSRACRGLLAQGQPDSAQVVPLDDIRRLSLFGVTATAVTYRGRTSVRIVGAPNGAIAGHIGAEAFIDGTDFHDGTIELWIAGRVAPAWTDTSARGFVGVAFRAASDGRQYETIYLRPTNGRANDQLRRNHAVQYESEPDYPWFRLRQETPGRYESYADIEPEAWTRIRIVVQGTHAMLFVNAAKQPTLIVNDLKLGDSRGQIGLWIGPGTEGWFSSLRISRAHASP
jgi:hypothetical protein